MCQAGTERVELGGDDSDLSQGLRYRGEESRLNSEGAGVGVKSVRSMEVRRGRATRRPGETHYC